MWTGNLTDMRKLDDGGWSLYYRLAGSEVPGHHPPPPPYKKKKNTPLIVRKTYE